MHPYLCELEEKKRSHEEKTAEKQKNMSVEDQAKKEEYFEQARFIR